MFELRPVTHGTGGTMDRMSELSQLLVCCWLMATKEPIPTSHGILDRALYDVYNKGGLPEWARRHLHFADSRVGLQCVELPAVLDRAQKAQLTTAPNPSYNVTQPRISQAMASRVLRKLNVRETDAAEWGRWLREAAERASEEAVSFGQTHQSSLEVATQH
jgi:hypothetical protein